MHLRLVLISLTIALIALSTAAARQPVQDCPALVERALSNLANRCGSTEGLSICYAHERVYASFTDSSQPVTLDIPGDRAPLNTIKTLTGSPADFDSGYWGVALLNLSPSAINETQAQYLASMILLGDMTLENADASDQAPMQSVKLTSGSGKKSCNDAPNALAILTNPGINLGFSINGVNMRLSSLAIFQSNSVNSLSVTIQGGQLEIVDGPVAQSGQTLVGVMDNTGEVLFWSAPRSANPDEVQTIGIVTSAFSRLNNTVSTSSPTVTPAIIPTIATDSSESRATPSSCGTTHVVQTGENLFRIALRYNVDFDAVVAANDVVSPYLIQPGQQLTIPCGS